MNKRVVGLDVSKDNVAACLLEDMPVDPREHYLTCDFDRFYANPKGIQELLKLKPDIAVLEPTGVNYSKLWYSKLSQAGVEVWLVGHNELKVYRKSLDLPDKDDFSDSLALACYWFQHHRNFRRFVQVRDPVISLMRERVLRLHHLNRLQSPMINRIKQDLAWAFPEKVKVQSGSRLFWRWLAGIDKSVKYDSELKASCGYGITDDIRFSAQQLAEVHQREKVVEHELLESMNDPRFESYRKVFAQYGMGLRVQALILSQIYPLENYLDNGKPIRLESRSKENPDKKTIKHLSLRRFKKALGVAPVREWSGDKKRSSKAGSELCRTAIWQWIFTRVEIKRNRLENDTFRKISDRYDAERRKEKPVKLVRGRVSAYMVQRLFYDLVDETQGRSTDS